MKGFSGSSAGKESACNAGDPSSVPGSGRSPGEGNSYPFQYSGMENSMDCIVHGVAKSQTQLSDFHFHFAFKNLTFAHYCFFHSLFVPSEILVTHIRQLYPIGQR